MLALDAKTGRIRSQKRLMCREMAFSKETVRRNYPRKQMSAGGRIGSIVRDSK